MKIDMGESFGQRRPPLYEMIKNILREYPSGQIFKVFIELCAIIILTPVSLDSCKILLYLSV